MSTVRGTKLDKKVDPVRVAFRRPPIAYGKPVVVAPKTVPNRQGDATHLHKLPCYKIDIDFIHV